MADPQATLERLIEKHGGKLIRQKKHKVFRFPNGVVFTTGSTPEDPRAYDNATAELKRLLGLHSPDRGAPGQRRENRVKRKPMGGILLPSVLHEIPIGEWKKKLDAVKGELPEKPMSSTRIIKHPIHNFTKQPISERPLVAIDGLRAKFGHDRER